MANRRILIFSTAYLPFIGGAEIAVKELTDRLSQDFEFDLITAKLDSQLLPFEKLGPINVYRIGIGIPIFDKLILPFAGAKKALKLSKERDYALYWGVMASFSTGAAYIANLWRMSFGSTKIPIVLTLQEGDSERHLQFRWFGLLDLSWRAALALADHLTAISSYLLLRAERLGYRGEKTLIPNGVDMKKFSTPNFQFPKNSKEIILVTTSRLVEKNAVGDVIEAMKYLPENYKFRIIGTGSLENTLKEKARKLGVTNRVEFLGFVPQNEIPKYLRESDIFVRPSLSEGMGNSFIEAMAAGLPVIATPVGGIPDFLKNEETGLFVEPKQPRLIAFQVQKLVNDRVLRDKIVINARRMVRERYDWDLIVKDMKDKVFNTL